MQKEFYARLQAKHGKLYNPNYTDWLNGRNLSGAESIFSNVFNYLNWKRKLLNCQYEVRSTGKNCFEIKTNDAVMHAHLRMCLAMALDAFKLKNKYCIATFPIKQSPVLETCIVVYDTTDFNIVFIYKMFGGDSERFIGTHDTSRRDKTADSVIDRQMLNCIGRLSLVHFLKGVDDKARYVITPLQEDGITVSTKNKEFVLNYMGAYMKACVRRGIPTSIVEIARTKYLFQMNKDGSLIKIKVNIG